MTSRGGTMRGFWVLAAIFVLSLPAVTTRINASDEIQFFAWLHSWTFDRDVDFENEYRYFHDTGPGRHPGFVSTFLEDVNEAGRRLNFAPIGSAVLWLPFYGVGHLVATLTDWPADGFSHPYIAGVAYGSAVYGFLAILLSVDIARRLLGSRGGLTAALAIWLGTPLLFYMYVAPGFAHACSAFAVALFLWIWVRVRAHWSLPGLIALGLAGALLPMVREQDLFFVAGPALDFLRWLRGRLRGGGTAGSAGWQQVFARAAAGVVAFGLAYAPQLLAYQALNGHPGPTVKVMRKMSWTSPHFVEVLFSPEHGLFFWTPLALIAVLGLAWLCVHPPPRMSGVVGSTIQSPDVRWIAGLMLMMVVLQVYVSGSVESWTVAGAFGQRRFVALTPILVVGLAAFNVPSLKPAATRWLATGLTILTVWWNIGLMAQFGLHLMDRQRLTLRENIRVTFVDLPRLVPAIVIRYFTDRESFYGLSPQDR